MVEVNLEWPDGTKIYYKKDSSKRLRRVVDYPTGMHVSNAGKFYYLKVLENYRDIGQQTYKDLKYICDLTTSQYDENVERELCKRFSTRFYGEDGTEIFMTLIYLAMVDCEAGKANPNWPGKLLVLKSCKAVLLDNIPYDEVANIYEIGRLDKK